MKKIILGLLLALSFTVNAQLTFELRGVINKKISSTLIEDKNVELKSIDIGESGVYKATILCSDKEETIDLKHLERISFQTGNLR